MYVCVYVGVLLHTEYGWSSQLQRTVEGFRCDFEVRLELDLGEEAG